MFFKRDYDSPGKDTPRLIGNDILMRSLDEGVFKTVGYLTTRSAQRALQPRWHVTYNDSNGVQARRSSAFHCWGSSTSSILTPFEPVGVPYREWPSEARFGLRTLDDISRRLHGLGRWKSAALRLANRRSTLGRQWVEYRLRFSIHRPISGAGRKRHRLLVTH